MRGLFRAAWRRSAYARSIVIAASLAGGIGGAGIAIGAEDSPFDAPEWSAPEDPWGDQRRDDGRIVDEIICESGDNSPRWFTVRTDALILERVGVQSHVLLTDAGNGSTLLSTSDAVPGWAAGPELDFRLHLSPTTDFEFEWFSVKYWDGQQNAPLNGGIVEPVGAALSSAVVGVTSQLRNYEFNLRRQVHEFFTLLAGFRYVELNDGLGYSYSQSSTEFTENAQIQGMNRLYGFQIGGQGMMWRSECWWVDAWLKGGIYGNAASQSTDVLVSGFSVPSGSIRASASHAAFVGDLGLRLTRRFGEHTMAFVGYRLMFLGGVALAANQYDNVVGFFNGGGQRVTTDGSLWLQGIEVGITFSY
ncbi:MAG TPA: BBP7 family outer membrane beta-barrel protein [Planctomycetaceae bacterium]|jgi:hypothetical protein|nr:BBP7 family outer membrane beta-barrel protein [Planctomycetaceae bacterium]